MWRSTFLAASREALIAVAVVLPSRGLQEMPNILTGLPFEALAGAEATETAAPAASVLVINFLRFIFVPPNLVLTIAIFLP
jgi:hypothetical protein